MNGLLSSVLAVNNGVCRYTVELMRRWVAQGVTTA